MVRLLSIDFDYFIDTDLDTRNNKFPDGADNIPKDKLSELWNYFYERYPEIKLIGVIQPQFNAIKHIISRQKFIGSPKCMWADSHGDIEKLFKELEEYYSLEVTHIDFHHDNYISGGSEVDCANWVRCLVDRRDKLHLSTTIKWIRREDSEIVSLAGDFPYEHTTHLGSDEKIDYEFDYIFLCFSPEWTPPHLRNKFDELVSVVK